MTLAVMLAWAAVLLLAMSTAAFAIAKESGSRLAAAVRLSVASLVTGVACIVVALIQP